MSWIRIHDNYVYGLPKPEQLFVNRYGTNNDVQVDNFIGVQTRFPG